MPLSAIRLAQPADAAVMQAIYAPIVATTPISFELVPPTIEEMRQRLAKIQQQFPWLVRVVDDVVIGYAYASAHRERAAYQWAADVSVYVHDQWRGQGTGRTLYRALFALLRAQGYLHVYAGIALPNAGSVALHEKMGMVPVGSYRQVGFKLGAWHDVGWWQGQLGPLPPAPTSPTPIGALMVTGMGDEILTQL